jgi:coproporphyrinogen III oxidase-like Fe-S oxidoreductase
MGGDGSPWKVPVTMSLIIQEQMMDAKEQVKRDLVHFFRTYKASALSMHVGPLKTHTRGYNARWQDALEPAIDDLVAEGLLERHGNKIALTEKGKQEVFAPKIAG